MSDNNKNINGDNSSNENLQNETKPNGFVLWLKKVGKMFVNYLVGIGKNIARSISDNPSIIWALLLAVPGVFIGLFLTNHIRASYSLTEDYNYSGIMLFIMELAGCINIATAFSVKGKRNIKSSVYASIGTAIIAASGIYWVYCLLTCDNVWVKDSLYRKDAVISVICISISVVTPIIGAIGSFFTRNKNYVKETF